MFGFFKKLLKNDATGGDVPTGKSWQELTEIWEGLASESGVVVSRTSSLQVAAVYACVKLISGAIGGLQLRIYRKEKDGSRNALDDIPLAKILSRSPSPFVTAMVFWETIVADILLDGNAYAIIDRDRNGNISRLVYVDPRNVEPRIYEGRLIYVVAIDIDSEPLPPRNAVSFAAFESHEVLHFPGLGWNGKKGLSVIGSIARNTIGNSLSADRFSAKFFSQGLQAPGYLRFPEKLSQTQFEMMREYWRKKVVGADNAHLPPIVTEGGEFKPLNIRADDVQLLETRKFQVEDIARIFGVPPHMIGSVSTSTSWGSGIEQQSMGFVRYTLRPNLTRIEQELDRKLFIGSNDFVEFDAAQLLRGDVKGRNESHQIALGGNQQPGWKTVNEIRREENLPPVANGDQIYKPLTAAETDEKESTVVPDSSE